MKETAAWHQPEYGSRGWELIGVAFVMCYNGGATVLVREIKLKRLIVPPAAVKKSWGTFPTLGYNVLKDPWAGRPTVSWAASQEG